MTTVGLHGAGHMGSGLGWALRAGGARVVTTLAGRSARTRKLVADAGLEPLDSLDAVVAAADVVLTVVPPDAARNAAVAATKAHRFVPEMHEIAATQLAAGLPGLFTTMAEVYAQIAGTDLAGEDPEGVDRAMPPAEVIRRLGRPRSS